MKLPQRQRCQNGNGFVNMENGKSGQGDSVTYCSVDLKARRNGGRKMLKKATGIMASQNGGGSPPELMGSGPVMNETTAEHARRLAFVNVQKCLGVFILLCRTSLLRRGAVSDVASGRLLGSSFYDPSFSYECGQC